MAESTKSAYRSQLNAFLRFCLHFALTPVPVEQGTLKCYVAFLARSLNPSSIPGYLNVVRLLHLNAGLVNPLKDNFEIVMLRRGITRKLGRPPLQKLPITIVILRKMYGVLDMSIPTDLAFWTACLIGFYGLFRKSTLLPISSSSVSPAHLIRDDVHSLTKTSCLLRVRHTKTIQFGQRVILMPFVSCVDETLCPVTNLIKLLGKFVLPKHVSLFACIENGRCKILTHSVFVKKLKSLLESLGYMSKSYSGHSFRRGGCTFCFKAGLSLCVIKIRGDWKSQAFERYLFVPASAIYDSAVPLAEYSQPLSE